MLFREKSTTRGSQQDNWSRQPGSLGAPFFGPKVANRCRSWRGGYGDAGQHHPHAGSPGILGGGEIYRHRASLRFTPSSALFAMQVSVSALEAPREFPLPFYLVRAAYPYTIRGPSCVLLSISNVSYRHYQGRDNCIIQEIVFFCLKPASPALISFIAVLPHSVAGELRHVVKISPMPA